MIGYKELIQKLKKIKEMGWIKTHRAGTTGIGKSTVIIFLISFVVRQVVHHVDGVSRCATSTTMQSWQRK